MTEKELKPWDADYVDFTDKDKKKDKKPLPPMSGVLPKKKKKKEQTAPPPSSVDDIIDRLTKRNKGLADRYAPKPKK